MDEATWRRVKRIFQESLEVPPPDRGGFVRRACGDDAGIFAEVKAMLAAADGGGAFLEPPGRVDAPVSDDVAVRSLVGARLGAYRIEAEIAGGGMGTVYRAVRADAAFDQVVAIKVVRAALTDAHFVRRFHRERQVLARLTHANIARLYDGGVADDGRPYLVMEFVDGRPITEFAARRSLDVDGRLALFRQVCDAVQYAHRNLVVHRDIKPNNVVVTTDGVSKLLDFGIAKVLDDADEADRTVLTQPGMAALTPQYASPEQLRGEPVTTATDVYSLGVLLYELLTGRGPYDLRTGRLSEIERAVCDLPPLPPSSAIRRGTGEPPGDVVWRRVRRRIAGDLDNIILMALRKEPQRRYATVEQFSEDIRRHIAGLPVIARPDAVGYRLRKFAGRHRVGVTLGTLLGLSLVGGMVATTRMASVAERERVLAEDARMRAEAGEALACRLLYAAHMNVAQQAFENGHIEQVVALLDRHRPQAGRPDLRGFDWRLLWAMCHVDVTLHEGNSPIRHVAVRPGGREAVGIDDEGRAVVCDLSRSGAAYVSDPLHEGAVRGLCFAAGGRRLVTVGDDGFIRVFDPDNRDLLHEVRASDGPVTAVTALDGSSFAVSDAAGTIRSWSIETGDSILIHEDSKREEITCLAASAYSRMVAAGTAGGRILIGPRDSSARPVEIIAHGRPVGTVAFDPDGSHLVSGGGDEAVRLWRCADGSEIASPPDAYHWGEVTHASFTPDGAYVVSASLDGRIQLWNLRRGRRELALRGNRSGVSALAAVDGDGRLVSGGEDGTIRLWDPWHSSIPLIRDAHAGPVLRVVTSHDGRVAATGGADNAVALWECGSGRSIASWRNGERAVSALAWSPDDAMLAAAGEDGSVSVWDAAGSTIIARIKTDNAPINDLVFTADATLLAACADGTVRRAAAPWAEWSQTRQAAAAGVTAIAARRTDGALLCGDETGGVVVLPAGGGEPARVSAGDGAPIRAVAWSTDGRRFAVAGPGREAAVFSAVTLAPLHRLALHTGDVFSVQFSADGATILTAGGDGDVKMWDAETGEQRLALYQDAPVLSAALTPDDGRLIVGCEDGTVRIWNAPPPGSRQSAASGAVPRMGR